MSTWNCHIYHLLLVAPTSMRLENTDVIDVFCPGGWQVRDGLPPLGHRGDNGDNGGRRRTPGAIPTCSNEGGEYGYCEVINRDGFTCL